MHQPHLQRAATARRHRRPVPAAVTSSSPARPGLAAFALAAVLALASAPAAAAATPQMTLPETTVLHIHLLQSPGEASLTAAERAPAERATGPAAVVAPAAALPADLARLAGAAAPPGRPLVLLGSAVVATTDGAEARIAGPGGRQAELELEVHGRSADQVHLRHLRVQGWPDESAPPHPPRTLLHTSATLRFGDPAVVGTSYLGPELGTLIVVVEARPAS